MRRTVVSSRIAILQFFFQVIPGRKVRLTPAAPEPLAQYDLVDYYQGVDYDQRHCGVWSALVQAGAMFALSSTAKEPNKGALRELRRTSHDCLNARYQRDYLALHALVWPLAECRVVGFRGPADCVAGLLVSLVFSSCLLKPGR